MLADMARTGFYREVAIKSLLARQRRALLKARNQLLKQRLGLDNTMRGLLRSFGIRLPKGTGELTEWIKQAIIDRPDLGVSIEPLLEADPH